MKKFFIILVAALAATLNLSAQDDWKHELSISYGFGAFTDLSSSYLKGIFSGGKQTNYIGPFGIEYFYRTKSALGVGVVGTFSTCKWFNREHLSLYSKVALGVILGIDSGDDDNKTSASLGWQASLVGAEFGSAFRGFIEVGCGEQGIILAGLRYKF